jgi:hypothetical protein
MRDPLWDILTKLPSDYKDYGGDIERWKYIDVNYPDCSSGCKHWRPLWDEPNEYADADWGICSKKDSPRAGLLTWEHQAGFGCFEYEREK